MAERNNRLGFIKQIITVIGAAVIVVVMFAAVVVLLQRTMPLRDAFLLTMVAFSISVAIRAIVYSIKKDKQIEEKFGRQASDIQAKAEQEPQKSQLAWEAAQTRLEEYFALNLNQVKMIFWISIAIMIAGMGFLIYAMTRSFDSPETLTSTYVAGIAGAMTEFIGATFMLLYKSTMRQALQYTATLERINRVGMAVQILDSIPEKTEKDTETKNRTRSEIAKMLLAGMWGADMP